MATIVGPLALALGLGLGCGAEAPATYRDYALRTAQASCERVFRCCGRSCSTAADANFNKSLESTQFALDTGLVTFDSARAQSCLEATAAVFSDCNQYSDLVDTSRVGDACEDVLQGALPLGAACSTTTDYCRPGSYCESDTSQTPAQLRCGRKLNINEPCDGSVPCVEGSTCDAGNVCAPLPPTAKFGEACSGGIVCDGSLVCLPDAKCGLPQEGGTACASNGQCLSNRCAVDTCTVAMTKPRTISDDVCGP